MAQMRVDGSFLLGARRRGLRSLLMVAVFTAASLPASGAGGPARYPSIEHFGKSKPGYAIESGVHGDLNGDGRADWVGAIVSGASLATPDGSGTRQLHILLQQADGSYALAASTKPFKSPPPANVETEFGEFEIAGGVFSFKQRDAWRGCSTRYIHQFARHGTEWRLSQIVFEQDADMHDEGMSLVIERDMVSGHELVRVNGRVTGKYKYPGKTLLFSDFSGGYADALKPARGTRRICS